MMDGLELLRDLVHPSMVLVLDAPDDVLKARAEKRGREGDHNFGERLAFYRTATEPVVSAYRNAGITRHVDATSSQSLVLASALYHFEPTLVFAPGKAALYVPVLDKVEQRLGEKMKRISVDQIRKEVDSKALVPRILQELALKGCWGKLVVVEGFPEDVAEHKAFPQEALLILDFQSRMGFLKEFPSSFVIPYCNTKNSVDTVTKLLQNCLPLQLAPPLMAINLLKRWMDCARSMPWWDIDFFRFQAKPSYFNYMRQQAAAARAQAEEAKFTRPFQSPPSEAWLCWLTHQLHTESYTHFCKQLAGVPLTLGPMPPALVNTLSESMARTARKPTVATANEGLQEILLERDALVNIPVAFVLAFAAFEEAGLSPLSDPRTVVFRAEHPGSRQPDLMSCFLNIMNLFYRRFFLVMGQASPESLAGPAVELDWVWHAHMMHPLYSEDCLQLFGHVVPHIPCKPGDAERVRKSPPDDSRLMMAKLDELLRSQLRALAASRHLTEALEWEFPKDWAQDASAALGCFIPGGNNSWLSERLESSGGRLGQAFVRSLKNPAGWICPVRTEVTEQKTSERDPALLEVSVRLMSGEKLLDCVMHKDCTIKDLMKVCEEAGEADFKLLMEGVQASAEWLLGATAIARGEVVHLVRVPRPPPVITRRTSSPDWNRIPCTCFTDFCQFQVLVSGREVSRFMRDIREGDIVRTGSDVEQDRYRQVVRVWKCKTVSLSETVELAPGCRLTVPRPHLDILSLCRLSAP